MDTVRDDLAMTQENGSGEAHTDLDLEETEAYAHIAEMESETPDPLMSDSDIAEASTEADETPADPSNLESIVGEVTDGDDTAVVLPGAAARGSISLDDVDGTDAEAVFEEEQRETEDIESRLERRRGRMPDVYDVSRRHRGER